MKYQWHIFLASLEPTKGSEQAGKRPVLLISWERINQMLPVVNVIPLSSRKFAARPFTLMKSCCRPVWRVCK